jgi:hypothetical protein
MAKILAFASFILALAPWGAARQAEFRGQLSAWSAAGGAGSSGFQLGFRYIPTLSFAQPLSGSYALDVEMSVNAQAAAMGPGIGDLGTSGRVSPYRVWLRFSGPQFEARVGLQKISFGQAALLRPLMWFDGLDPNDPLQLTTGVYGLLLRYTFRNNANVWLWGLYGNEDLKGWETTPTQKKTPEYGGRLQFPLFKGEIALSYHRRRIDPGGASAPKSRSNRARSRKTGWASTGNGTSGSGSGSRERSAARTLRSFP